MDNNNVIVQTKYYIAFLSKMARSISYPFLFLMFFSSCFKVKSPFLYREERGSRDCNSDSLFKTGDKRVQDGASV